MVQFYRDLWQEKFPAAQALQAAQRVIIERFDIQTGSLRGLRTKPQQAAAGNLKPNPNQTQQLHPRYWSASQLSRRLPLCGAGEKWRGERY